ncbi:MAG: hypothetical protein H7282_05070 [Cytophagaceae bacterium]|nr:hypothetical protein [Cytophagaceae bacterium]
MSLLDRSRIAAQRIITDKKGFGQDLTFSTPGNTLTVIIAGRHTKHRMGVSTEGLPVNAKNASVTVVEKTLTDLSYPVRDSKGEVSLIGHLVSCVDSRTSVVCNYIVLQNYPDESLGIIVCLLGDHE